MGELRDLFADGSGGGTITLGNLALALGTVVGRLLPLAQHGYLKVVRTTAVQSDTLVESPPPAAVLWLRGWLQPAQAKPLLSHHDVAGLLGITPSETVLLAAEYEIPLVYDEALGWLFSVWGARTLVVKTLTPQRGQRFDRLALLWWLAGDPEKAAPDYSEQLEEELARVAQLDEPARSARTRELLDVMHDAEELAKALRVSERRLAD